MTRITQNFAAACAALFIVAVTWTPVITVPVAQASAFAPMPILV